MLNKILYFFKPFQMWIQGLGYQETEFTSEEINYLLSIIKGGDVLGSYESGRFTSAFIKGNFDHVAIVDHNLYVVEAVGDKWVPIRGAEPETDWEKFKRTFFNKINLSKVRNAGGVRKVALEKWLWTKNHIFIGRHKCPVVAVAAAKESNKYIGSGYDYSFYKNNEFFSCVEIPYISIKPFDEWFMNGVAECISILPVDYLREYNLDIIYNSRNKTP